jgi:EAL domain-containing protein (putative c-di-GMP-specific phosphodiesterase class I)
MARALSLDVVATGVETAEQHAALAALGCPRAQGGYYGPPVDVARAGALLRRGVVARPPGA